MLQLFQTVLLLVFTCTWGQELQSPRTTQFGYWYQYENCSTDTYAAGMNIKFEAHKDNIDDTAMNAIALYCLPFGWENTENNQKIISGQGFYGTWQKVQWCPKGQVIIGFQLRSEIDRGDEDDVAGVNFAAYCGSPYGERDVKNFIIGESENWGDWTSTQLCSPGYAICGIKTQVDHLQKDVDVTSLNNVDVNCCKVASNCLPDVRTHTIGSFDNSKGAGVMSFEHTVTTSFSSLKSGADNVTKEEKKAIAYRISSQLDVDFIVSAKMSAEFGIKTDKKFLSSLQKMVQETVERTQQKKISINIPAGKRTTLEQLFFTCGDYRVGTPFTVSREF